MNQPDKLLTCLVLCLCCSKALPNNSQSEDAELVMQRLRNRVAAHLNELRNYTCRVVIDRSELSMSNGADGNRDRVELNVAFVNDRELFAKPGDTRFDVQVIRDLVPAGMIGDDALGTHDDASFLGDLTTLAYEGEHKKDGHQTFQLDFRIRQEASRLYVKGKTVGAMVGYKGHLWVDTETLDTVRVEWRTEQIPSPVGIMRVTKLMRYRPVHIRDRDVLLPVSTELTSIDQAGTMRLNVVHLEHCQAFAADSTVKYDLPADQVAPHSSPARPTR